MASNPASLHKPCPDTALVVEGGAMRGIFSTGVLDGFLAREFNPFDIFFGVSSGSGNLAAFLARMPRRNLKIYTDYSQRPEFINWKRAALGGPLMDLDWLWEITIREIRLDLSTIFALGRPFIVCLTDAETGAAVYQQTDAANLEPVLKASSALPVLYNTFPVVDGRKTLDGGLSDPLPVRAALEAGAKKIMIIRSRPRRYRKKTGLGHRLLQWRLCRYPALRQTLAGHADRYNRDLELIRRPPRGTTIVEICPPENFRPNRLERSRETLYQGYDLGKMMADEAIRRWEEETNR